MCNHRVNYNEYCQKTRLFTKINTDNTEFLCRKCNKKVKSAKKLWVAAKIINAFTVAFIQVNCFIVFGLNNICGYNYNFGKLLLIYVCGDSVVLLLNYIYYLYFNRNLDATVIDVSTDTE